MDIKVNESCLIPSHFDIVVDGQRYGVVYRDIYFNWVLRRNAVRWFARMDIAERISPSSSFLDVDCIKAETLDEAVHLAFEDLAANTAEISLTESAQVAMSLFKDAEPAEDVIAEVDRALAAV